MENASKALLMAGGILIAIIIIALLVRSFSTISSFQKQKLTEEEQAQLEAFNKQYTKYVGQYVYGTEVRSLMNKCESDKQSGKNYVEVIYDVEPPTGTGQETKYYQCISVQYGNNGRVTSITFKNVTP